MKPLTIILIIQAINLSSVFADGLESKDGRCLEKKVVMTILPEQLKQANSKSHNFVLTPFQKNQLIEKVGFSPRTLTLTTPRNAYSDCGCFFYNTAVLFSYNQADVPTGYLLTEDKAKRRDVSIRSMPFYMKWLHLLLPR